MSNLTTFVKQTLPEFIRTDHPMFETFVASYYEWLESTNSGTSSSNKDLYKELPNSAAIISNAESFNDIDETLEQFIDFFASTLVPISIDNIKSDPRFFLKKTRDLYLAKGTPKSFELFFKIFFNEEIDIYETKDNILKTSDGKFLSFPVAHFYIEEFGEYLEDFDFSFSTISDSDTLLGTILQANLVDKETASDKDVLKIIFSTDVVLEKDRLYYVEDSNSGLKITIKPLLSISNIRVKDSGSLYNNNDTVVFKTTSFGKNFIATISDVSSGKVDAVSIRNPGYLYKPSDKFNFVSNEDVGDGGSFTVTSVGDSDGNITSIDNVLTKSGYENRGWSSNSFKTALIPLKSGGRWNKLPNVEYKPILSIDRSVDFDDTYLQSMGRGLGAQITPTSTSIGKIEEISFNQTPYFIDSDDVNFTVPTNIIVENIDNVFEGDVVSFRYWKENPSNNLLDDSEEIIFVNRVYSNFYYITGSDSDSESTSNITLNLPNDYDSDNFKWKSSVYEVYPHLASPSIWSEYDSDLDLSTLDNTTQYSFNNDNSIDGGFYGYVIIANTLDGNDTYSIYYDGNLLYTQSAVDSDFDVSALIPLSTIIDGNDSDQLPDILDGDSDGVNYYIYIDSENIIAEAFFNSETDIDGGTFNSVYDERTIDGGISYDFSRSLYHEIVVTFSGKYSTELEQYHIDQLDNYVVDNEKVYNYWSVNDTFEANLNTLADVGKWLDTGNYAKVSKINGSVVQLLPYSTYTILEDSDYKLLTNDKYNLVKIESVYENDLSPKDEDYSPIQNIVHQISKASIEFDYEIITRKDKLFWDESGFLSSSGKSVIQDNYYYSDYTYNITTNIPYTEWRNEVKETLHPAGMILTATAVVNSNVETNPNTSIDAVYEGNTQRFTFDSMMEYGEDPTPYVFTENFQRSEDNIIHRIEKFNEANKELDFGWVVSSDDINVAPNLGYRQQKGDSFWDYEPLGWVSEYSTQDSDGNGKVKSEVVTYSPNKGLYRQQSRYSSLNLPVVYKTEFTLSTDSEYNVIDSDLPTDLFVDFNDSDNSNTVFKTIDYSRLKTNNDNKAYQLYPAKRKLELVKIKMNDLNEASKENNSLVYTDKDGTYYDYDAYEKKWNQDNTRRFTHESGWYKDGYNSYYQNIMASYPSENRSTLNFQLTSNNVTETVAPLNKVIFEGESIVWRDNYGDSKEINTIEDSNTETYRDPKVSMRGRRG